MSEHKYKMGKPSIKEIEFIRAQTGQMSDEDIAAELNRPISTVLKIKTTHGIDCVQEEFDDKEKMKVLRTKPFFKRLKRQLTQEELYTFQDKWVRYTGQFNNEIPPTEESIIVDLIRTEIMIDRLLEEQGDSRKMRESLTKLREEAEEELLDNKAVDREKTKDLIKDLAQQIQVIENSSVSRNKEVATQQGIQKDLRQALKATREQRVKRLEESKTNFLSLLKEAMTPEWQSREGDYLGLFNLSAKKLARKLSEIHVYSDGVVDCPFLNADTVHNLDDIQEENKEDNKEKEAVDDTEEMDSRGN